MQSAVNFNPRYARIVKLWSLPHRQWTVDNKWTETCGANIKLDPTSASLYALCRIMTWYACLHTWSFSTDLIHPVGFWAWRRKEELCNTIPMGVLWDQGREEILYTRFGNVCPEGFIYPTNSLHQGLERLSRGLYMPHKFSTPGMGNGCLEGFKCPTKSFSLALPRQPQLDLKFNKSHFDKSL